MGKRERRKGAAGELEVAKLFRAAGFDCDRTPNSGGLRIRGDLIGTVPVHVEVKWQETARPWQWWAQALEDAPAGELPVVAFRRSRSSWLGLTDLTWLAGTLSRLAELERLSRLEPVAAAILEASEGGVSHVPLEAPAPAE